MFWLANIGVVIGAELEVGASKTYTSIQSAINAAVAGDTITVAPGTYNENLSITKSLTLVGPNALVAALPESGWVRSAEAVVGSASGGTRVVINGGANVIEVHLTGFRFVGPTTGSAAGIYIYKSRGTIANNHFDNLTNTASFGGADIYTQSGVTGPWTFCGNRHDGRGWKYYSGDADEGTYGYSAINAWYLDSVTIHGNRIEGYGFSGIQLESTKAGEVTSNYIKNVSANGIQVANGASHGINVQGNTVDGASRLYESFFGTAPIDPEYGWGGIRIWQVSTSATSGYTLVHNNRVINTPARIGAIAFVGSNGTRQTLASVTNNSLDGSNSDGLLHIKAAVRAVSVLDEIATVCLWEGSSTSSGALSRTNHEVSGNVVISGLGAPFDGTHIITAVDAPADQDFFGDSWYYKTISFAVPGAADVTETLVQEGAAASELDAAVAIPAATNWWGAATGPGSMGASLNSAGASATSSPWIVSYSEGTPASGFIDGVGFWPTNIVSSESDGDSDGLTTGDELTIHFTDPANPDSDGDGLNDGAEVLSYFTNPRDSDSDGDGFDDAYEVAEGFDPLNLNDPIPSDGSVEEAMAKSLQDYASEVIQDLPLTQFSGPNTKSKAGRQNSLANRLFSASKFCLVGDFASAVEDVQSALSKISPNSIENSTWLVNSVVYEQLHEYLELLIYLRDNQV